MSRLNPNITVITIDGPSASGKSSVARQVAAQLGWTHVNTGNMYRAATLAVLEAGVDPGNADAVIHALSNFSIDISLENGRSIVRLNGRDVEDKLHSEAINNAVSLVARVPEVRARLVAMQKKLGLENGVVMEGRDIGTVVFPDALCKFYIDASETVRLKRRGQQGQTDSLKKRDHLDSTRKNAPLKAAADAIIIDSSDMTLAQVVARVMEVLRDRSFPPPPPKPDRMGLSYWLGWSFFKLCAYSLFNYRVIGRENLTVHGGAMIVCNHASFVDPPFVGIAFDEALHYLAKKSLFDTPIFGPVIRSWNAIPVDQDCPNPSGMRAVIRDLLSGGKALVFPEGSRSFDGVMLPGQPGTGLIVVKARVPVIPVRIFGSNVALPRGTSLPRPSEITVVIGKPWHYEPEKYTETRKALYQKISDELMAEIAALHV